MLTPGTGRAIFLSQGTQHLLTCLDSKYFLPILLTNRVVNIGGFICNIVVAARSDVVFVTPISGSDTWGVEESNNSVSRSTQNFDTTSYEVDRKRSFVDTSLISSPVDNAIVKKHKRTC
jgi:hypothetical protein